MTPVVAVASEFFDAFARIPRAEQRKVREFTEKFRQDPRSRAINYEKIHDVRDPRVRTVRIGKEYRAIILHPDTGDVYVLVWVDHHNEAMAWARRKTFEIHPVTGALQVFSVAEAVAAVEEAKADEPPARPARAGKGAKPPPAEPGLLDSVSDDDLLQVGVPAVLFPAVRAVKTGAALEALVRHLPAEAAEALTWLGETMPIEEVKVLVEANRQQKAVDTQDLARALEHPDTKRRFARIETQHDLAGMLNAPLEKWRIFLHPGQERLVTQDFNGPVRVLGGAGTGKTVVAMHRARHLARDLFREKTDRVLFTTYTENLARTVESSLKTLCEDEIERIEVVHLHAWAVRFMKAQGVQFSIASEAEIRECWREAVAVTEGAEWEEGFLRQEWDQVVQAAGISTRQDYLRVSRIGRGKTLTRADRDRIWNVFEELRGALRRLRKVEWLDVVRETREFLEKATGALLPYRAVVVDEAQDLHPEEWRLIRAIVPRGKNDLFIVGDAHQRIYARKVVLGQCGIDIRGRSRKLRINYRTTRQIKRWAESILTGVPYDDLDGGGDDLKGYTSLLTGPAPEIKVFPTLEEEQAFLVSTVRKLVEEFHPEAICLVARTNALRDKYAAALAKGKVRHLVLEKDTSEKGEGVRVATMHRVKGLEFRCMLLAGLSEGEVPHRAPSIEGDRTAEREHDARERSLVFVAATRARDRVVVTGAGVGSEYLE